MAKLKQKVMTGVVGHPVSEKGKRGGSPSRHQRNAIETELACRPHGQTALVIRLNVQG